MKVITKVKFFDKKEDKIRNVDDEFSISKERYKEIIEKGGDWLEEVEEKELQDKTKINKIK